MLAPELSLFSSSGSLAILAAMRPASSRVSGPGRCARIVEMHIGELLAFAVAHHEVMHRIAGRKTGRCPFFPGVNKAKTPPLADR